MAFHGDEDELWRCRKHPSRRRQGGGVCPSCLRERLLSLCPDCANPRPCSHCAHVRTPSFSSLSRFFSAADSSLRRSRSLAVAHDTPPPSAGSTRTRYSSLWSVFKTHHHHHNKHAGSDTCAAEMRRSKSVVEAKIVKAKGWHFPSPIGVFRQQNKVAVHRSPMCRG